MSPLDYPFLPDYDKYTCVESQNALATRESSGLNVTFVPMGFRKRIPKD